VPLRSLVRDGAAFGAPVLAVTSTPVRRAPSRIGVFFVRFQYRCVMHFSGATIFNPRPREDGSWEIEALCPDGRLEAISGFKSKAEIEQWLASGRCQSWLRARSYAYRDASPLSFRRT
jgi:hypothetical protein